MLTIIDNVLPVFAIMVLGHLLARREFISKEFFKASDRLVYFIFFPVMLFSKIAGTGSAAEINWPLTLGVLAAVFLTYLLSLAYVGLSRMKDYQVGAFAQCCYRFNGYVGLAMVMSILGEKGVREFAVLISLAVPFINLLAVSTLIWYSESSFSTRIKIKLLLKALLGNPLIIGCLSGIAYSYLETPLPGFFTNTFNLLSAAALPLALLAIGNALTFANLRHYLAPAVAAAVLKQAVLPVLGYIILKMLGVGGQPFQVALLYFALPTSPAAFILSSQLHSDPDMASSCIASSTLLSFVSLSVVMLLF